MKTEESRSDVGKLLRLIAGSGRSGTTGVLNALAEANALRHISEPLHTDTSAVGQKFGHAYLTRDSVWPGLEGLFSAAACGVLCTIWTDGRIKFGRLSLGRRHLRSRTELKALAHRWVDFARRPGACRKRRAKTATNTKCTSTGRRLSIGVDWDTPGNRFVKCLALEREAGTRTPHWCAA